eukprot:CAMPEP_0181233994 /NCGR_PEP_ID=MMETSP1096-20121128/36681_1 /TAXON_ID=156174 ORGANISM="Chrysochromulina ericina, Strain CCMP281" /NCGR_SAMPLE_ID=MMETSP1096 /ASSEMBLY_ACC=CAM_ASM_000453 /LENGTH=52 /DNA_ID=CAMNT_0023328629 /DNA_START=346 /DNA_END=504 /DNA_ORIENTATION=+
MADANAGDTTDRRREAAGQPPPVLLVELAIMSHFPTTSNIVTEQPKAESTAE